MNPWLVQVKGEKGSDSWEISLVRGNNELGRRSWGWFGPDKLLISHNGGPCRWPIIDEVWDAQIALAEKLCKQFNT